MKALVLLLLGPAAWGQSADLILAHGRVFIAPGRYAEAVAVSGKRIAAVGTDAEVLKLRTDKTKVVDLAGRAVTPGFHDAHVHFLKGSLQFDQADLNGTTSVAEIQERLRVFLSSHPGTGWVEGRGWDHTAFPGGKYPAAADLDAVIRTRPAALLHTDGHMLWVNSAALKLAKLTAATPDPPGGRVIRGPSGEPTGILEDSAMELMKTVLPPPGRPAMKAALLKGLALARESGVTSIQGLPDLYPGPIAVSLKDCLAAWRELDREGKVTLRYFAWGHLDRPGEMESLRRDFTDLPPERFRLGGLKGFVDGVISNRTAALLEPYSDEPSTSGASRMTPAELERLVERAHRGGFQVELHAIGDRAVRMSLDACRASEEKAAQSGLSLPDYPCKIEHIEVVDEADLPRFAALRTAASMQPSHMTYDNEPQNYNPERLGSRVKLAFAWRSLEKAGALLVFGTDWPVMPLEPRIELFAATTREHFNGKPDGGWIPAEKVALEDAVRHYTLDPARAIGRGAELGSIEPGKLADLAVFDRDLFSVSGLDLLKVNVDLTVFDGKVVYEREGAFTKN